MAYQPTDQLLERYADVLVNFALGGGKGVRRGEVVRIVAPECAKPLYVALHRAVWRAGAHALGQFRPDDDNRYNLSREFLELASEEQLDFFPEHFSRGLIDQIDHQVTLLAEADKHALEGVDPARIMRTSKALKPLLDWRTQKENEGRFTWTLALYGTPAMAAEAGLSEEEYWRQIIDACFLEEPDPIGCWREVSAQIGRYMASLNELPIVRLSVRGVDADLQIALGEHRRWQGGSGRNIPSFEIFTSPDWRGTEGWIRFNQPLYRYGALIEGIELHFASGRVVKASATRNEPLLLEMIRTEGADKVGEYSLTDARFSRITKFMAETLYDENVGGPYGNTHIALGKSYHDCYDGDPATVSPERWEELGFNDSTVHTDIISTADRTVTAYLADGSRRVIYEGGQFTLD